MKYYEVDFAITPMNEAACDILAALLGEVGFETFSTTDNGLLGYIQQRDWNKEAVQDVVTTFPLPDHAITFSVAEAPDEDWNSAWEETFTPIRLDDLVCIHDMRYPTDEAVRYDIRITPRLAFGTGSHETTRMLLRALCQMDLHGKNVVDAGTGTGILGILCAMRGANSVFAYDIDEWSVRNAEENAALNGVASTMEICEGDASVLKNVKGKDVLIANINRNILLADMPSFVRTLNTGAKVLLSGFYRDDIPYLINKGKEFGLELSQAWYDEEWAALLLEANALGGVNL